MILEHTILAERWKKESFPTLTIAAYAERVIDFVEHLDPGIYLERLCGTATQSEECLAPDWSRERWTPHNRLREILLERGCRQGRRITDRENARPALNSADLAPSHPSI